MTIQLTLIPTTRALDRPLQPEDRGPWHGWVSVILNGETKLRSEQVTEAGHATEAEARREAEGRIRIWTNDPLGLRLFAGHLLSYGRLPGVPEGRQMVAELIREAGLPASWMANLPRLGLELMDRDPNESDSDAFLSPEVIAIREALRRILDRSSCKPL